MLLAYLLVSVLTKLLCAVSTCITWRVYLYYVPCFQGGLLEAGRGGPGGAKGGGGEAGGGGGGAGSEARRG